MIHYNMDTSTTIVFSSDIVGRYHQVDWPSAITKSNRHWFSLLAGRHTAIEYSDLSRRLGGGQASLLVKTTGKTPKVCRMLIHDITTEMAALVFLADFPQVGCPYTCLTINGRFSGVVTKFIYSFHSVLKVILKTETGKWVSIPIWEILQEPTE